METLNNNILIAQFMGGKLKSDSTLNIKDNQIFIPFHGVCDLGNSGKVLKYETSWDWLMPVVEKIEELFEGKFLQEFSITNTRVRIMSQTNSKFRERFNIEEVFYFNEDYFEQTKIETVYKAVIKFIQFYNENKSV